MINSFTRESFSALLSSTKWKRRHMGPLRPIWPEGVLKKWFDILRASCVVIDLISKKAGFYLSKNVFYK